MKYLHSLYLALIATLILLVSVSSCDSSSGVIDDPEYEYQSGAKIVLRVHLFDTEAELRKHYKVLYQAEHGLDKEPPHVIGFAVFNRNIATREPNFCDIFVLKTPYASKDLLYTWGHELKHCLEGDFHK